MAMQPYILASTKKANLRENFTYEDQQKNPKNKKKRRKSQPIIMCWQPNTVETPLSGCCLTTATTTTTTCCLTTATTTTCCLTRNLIIRTSVQTVRCILQLVIRVLSAKIECKWNILAAWGMLLGLPATESPKTKRQRVVLYLDRKVEDTYMQSHSRIHWWSTILVFRYLDWARSRGSG